MTRRILPHIPRASFATSILGPGEAVFDTTNKKLYMGDGVTPGGIVAFSGTAVATWGGILGTLADQVDLATALAGKQPKDADLEAIAALTTTTFGRNLLTLADALALRTAAGAQAADADLDAIAALTTTAFGRNLLTLADAAALLAAAGAQAADQQLADLAALSYTGNGGKSLRVKADATGLEFVAAAGVTPIAIARQVSAGRFYPPSNMVLGTGTQALAAGDLVAVPFGYGVTLNGIAVEVTTAGAAGTKIRLGIYDVGANGKPGNLVIDAGEVDGATAVVHALAIPERIMGAPFFLVLFVSAGVTVRAGTISTGFSAFLFGSTSLSASPSAGGVLVNTPYGALPATFPAGAITAMAPMVAARGV